MEMNVCPFCGQGRIFKVRLKTDISRYSGSQMIRLCDECDGIWKPDEPITGHTGASVHVLAETLAAALPAISNKLAFLEELEDNIRQYPVYRHLDQLAAEQLSTRAKNGDGKTVTLADGSTVPADLTPENFMKSLYPVEMRFLFQDSTERSQADLLLGCKPDYFAGRRIRISINEQYRIECEGI